MTPQKQPQKKPATRPGLPQPPAGGREVEAGRYNFFNFEKIGQALQGTLTGTVKIPNQRGEERERFLILVDKETFVLPDHLDLSRKLADVAQKDGQTSRVWIQFLGKEKVEGVANPMAMYRVISYGGAI